MKWYAISGSWRTIDEQVIRDVTEVVTKIVSVKDGIITGGALGVDYIATQIVIDHGNPQKQLKLFLPIKLGDFCKHYFKRAREGVITLKQAEMITNQLKTLEKLCSHCIYDEWSFKDANIESYYGRNTKIVEACDTLYAFQVKDSQGTQDAINKAKSLGKEVIIKKYYIK